LCFPWGRNWNCRYRLEQWFSTYVRPWPGNFFSIRWGPCIIDARAWRLRNTGFEGLKLGIVEQQLFQVALWTWVLSCVRAAATEDLTWRSRTWAFHCLRACVSVVMTGVGARNRDPCRSPQVAAINSSLLCLARNLNKLSLKSLAVTAPLSRDWTASEKLRTSCSGCVHYEASSASLLTASCIWHHGYRFKIFTHEVSMINWLTLKSSPFLVVWQLFQEFPVSLWSHKNWLHSSQNPTIGPYPEPFVSVLYPQILFYIHQCNWTSKMISSLLVFRLNF
jgi:hypothetical protein